MSGTLFDPETFAPTVPSWQRPSSYPLYDGTPPHEAPATSREAAESIAPVVNHLQQVALDAILDAGRYGATDDEIEVATGMKHQTASARRRELYLMGIIRSTGTRPTRSGRKAKVWTST